MKCMQTKINRCGHFGFRDFALFCVPSKTAKFPFLTMDYSPWSSKNLIDWNQLKKFMQVVVDVKCMQTKIIRCGHFGFGDFALFCLHSKTAKFPFLTMDYSPWSSKNLID